MYFKIFRYTLGGVAIISIVATVFVTTSVFSVQSNQLTTQFSNSVQNEFIPTPVLTTGTWGIFDVTTGVVIAGNNIDVEHPIASVTKLFTAETVLMSTKKDTVFSITYPDVTTEGKAGGLTYGDVVTPYELLFPLLLESSNDAGEAIKRTLGEEFSNGITQIQESQTLSHTNISESSGLNPENISTVKDLSLYYTHLKKSYPHILDITQLYRYVGSRTDYTNNNPARRFASFTGGKHGYTEEAGRTFVGSFMEAGSNREIGVVLLGSLDLPRDIEALLMYSEDIK